ncbi:hypothetical protein PFLUV_G00050670 [Perca fluviatilis]|uniref:Uncharacterized protein n=1 Tax=Perca fluviatilis TaxID=8168 RepID=A0A6A5FKZ2_PERFL|nr:hypothetical protein PFLUV_G00050670 [Perca fluviatilis]
MVKNLRRRPKCFNKQARQRELSSPFFLSSFLRHEHKEPTAALRSHPFTARALLLSIQASILFHNYPSARPWEASKVEGKCVYCIKRTPNWLSH